MSAMKALKTALSVATIFGPKRAFAAGIFGSFFGFAEQ